MKVHKADFPLHTLFFALVKLLSFSCVIAFLSSPTWGAEPRKSGDIEAAAKIMGLITKKEVAQLEDSNLSPAAVKELRLEILARLDETKTAPVPDSGRQFKLLSLDTAHSPPTKENLGYKDLNFHYRLQFKDGPLHFVLISIRHRGDGQLDYGIAARAAGTGETGEPMSSGEGGNSMSMADLKTSPTATLSYVNRWAFLLFGFLCAAFMIAMAYQCARRCFGGRPKEILWLPFIFMGAFRIDMSWSDASIHVLPSQIVMFGVQARQAGPFGPWVVTAAFPVGALIYLIFLRRRFSGKARA